MSTQPMHNVCNTLARAIAHIRQEIGTKESRIRSLTERLGKLQSQPNPDMTQIQEIKKDRQELEEQLEMDRPQLNAFEDEFAASCGL